VRPSPDNTGASIGLLREELENLPETELVQVDTEWVQRFHAILDIVRQGIFIGSVLLAAAIVVIIGNTIRLDIQNRREEIEVTKLIGASNGFVRRPFLWTGLWYGLFGGLLAIGLVLYGLYLLQAPIARLAGLYHSDIKVLSFDPREIGTILGIGIGLGLVGSWFAVARHLRRIEPR
jgi:cell division transport system permease protein